MVASQKALRSQQELYLDGWTDRLIDLALGEADDYAPSTHWLNNKGSPLFDSRRVAVAAYRVGLSSNRPNDLDLHHFETSMRPTSIPIFTLNFHFLADLCLPGAKRELSSLRLTHPVLGRRPSSIPKEEELIMRILQTWIYRVDGIELENKHQIEIHLNDRSEFAQSRLGAKWKNISVRPMRSKRYASKASSNKFLAKALDAISLLQTGEIVDPTGTFKPLVEILINDPILRFDSKLDHVTN